MINKPIPNRVFSLWSLITAIEGMLVVFFLTKESSEPGSVFAFGLSSQRLIIVSSIFFIAAFFMIIAIVHYYQLASWNEFLNARPKLFRSLLVFIFLLEILVANILLFLPDYHFQTFSGYLLRLIPILIWLVLFFAQTFIFLAYYHSLSLGGVKDWRGNMPVIIAFVTMMITWGVIVITKLGITPDDYYWNMSGVPILAGQTWAAIGVTIIGWLLLSQLGFRGKKETSIFSFLIFIGIWIAAAIIWVKTPLVPTFNAPGPYLPNKGFYPFVDAALYDLGAQSAIYGRGINFGSFIDRGLLMGFLAVLHTFFGQNYLMIANAQAAVYAVFPALLYLLGEKLYGKAVGLMVAMLAIFKVSNAISGGKWLSTSHPKLLLTEFPTGIVLVLFSLFLVKWLEESKSKSYALAGAAASIGIGILLRQNVFFMVPVAIVFGTLMAWSQNLWKHAVRNIFLFVIAFFITISPWMWRSQRVGGEPLFFLPQFYRVIEERYQPQSNLNENRINSSPTSRALKTNLKTSVLEKNDIFDQYQFIPKHFVHNIITSVLVLPPSPVLDDLRHVVDNYPYWDRMTNRWKGQISSSMGIFLAMNLIVLSIGFGVVWKRVRFAALVPLAVFLFYNLANAFARTSGGRYIVPVDWVVYFYYAVGLVEIIRFCILMLGYRPGNYFDGVINQQGHRADAKFNWGKVSLAILPFFLVVAALPIIELASPGDTSEKPNELLQQLDDIEFYETTNFSKQQVEDFLQNPDAVLIAGRGLYPRYYTYEQGEPIMPGRMTVYTARDYPRLVFTLLLPNQDKPVLLPIDDPGLHFPDAVKVIVGGCQVGQSETPILTSYLVYIDAAFVVILDGTETIYTRVPEAPLNCPLREPVCDNNHNCK